MSGSVSPSTARLCLEALRVALRLAAPRLNGTELPESWRVATEELRAALRSEVAADGSAGGVAGSGLPRFELIDVAEASRRLGVAPRTVRWWCAKGRLPATRIGRTWAIGWRRIE